MDSVLTGDFSGGIRGIIELVILTRLVEELGFSIPIQQLFDLVIGTSTGKLASNRSLPPKLTLKQVV
jgi:hypothetical protein